MQERINGEWVRLNPLEQERAWNLRYHQHLETRPDRYDPQVNDLLVEAITGCTAAPPQSGQACPQDNGVASGFRVYTTAGGLVEFTTGNPPRPYARAHVADVAPDSGPTSCNYTILGAPWNGPLFNASSDRLVVYGNLGITARVRDVAINSAPGHGTSSGCGLTIRHLNYSIENPFYDIQVPIKYDLTFDAIRDVERNQVDQIFGTGIFDPNHVIWGNNDFIELRSGDDTYLSPYPHPLIFHNATSVQSNGIWFTKARGDTEDVFQYTPDANHVAGCNIGNFSEGPPAIREAKYPDSEYILKFFAQDDFGRVNRDASGSDVAAQLPVIVDNHRPFVQKVRIDSDTFPIYSSTWRWTRTGAQGTLALAQDTSGKQADRGKPLSITVTTSEPMHLTTDASGKPTGSLNITLFARDPQTLYRIITKTV